MRVLPLLVLTLALPALAGCAAVEGLVDAPAAPANVTFEAARFDTTLGAFTIIFYPEAAPATVEFMKGLIDRGYYDGREFNRVIPGFVIQEVDRAGGATDQSETVPLEAGTNAFFSMGALGVARDVDPNSGGSEFFVMDFAHSHLYGNYTVFAQVIEGMDVVHGIARVDAISTRQGPAATVLAQLPVHDRIAVQPAAITTATLLTVSLPADVAAQFPRVVGERTVVDEPPTRYTPEWPADLAPGRAAAMTWFVYTSADEPPPDLRTATAVVTTPSGGNATIPTVADPADVRIRHWPWTPGESGVHRIALHVDGELVAENDVTVA